MKYFKPILPVFSDPDVWKELKVKCYDGTINYEDYPAPEYKYFDRLRICYLKFKFAGYPESEAAAEARLLEREYNENIERQSRAFAAHKEYQDNICRASNLRSEINLSNDPMKKLQLALECIEVMTGEKGFASRNMKNLTEFIERI